MIYILDIDGIESTRWKYNVWSVNELEGKIPSYEKDTRIFETDNLDELSEFLQNII